MKVFNVNYDVFTNKDCNSKFILIGDLHGWIDNKQINKVVNAINDNNPDIILIAGDILKESNEWLKSKRLKQTEKLFRSLTENNALLVTVLGNHDTHKVSDELLHNYHELGNIPNVYPLFNSSVDINKNNEDIHIAGFTSDAKDGVTAYTNTVAKIKGKDERAKRIIEKINPLLDIDKKKINILLTHDPRQLRMPEIDEATKDFDIRLAAHIHNGYLPFTVTTKNEKVLDQDWAHYLFCGIPKLKDRNFARGVAYGNTKYYVLCTQTNDYYLVVYNKEKKDNEYLKITMEEAIDLIKKYNLTPNVITGGINRYVGIPLEGSEITQFTLKKV